MNLVARVFDLEITDEEVLSESENLIGRDSFLAQTQALNRLIDRYLLLHQAMNMGLTASEDEFDSALMETLEELETAPLDEEQTRQMEQRIQRRVIIRKYVQQLCDRDILIADDKLLAFYEDQREVFFVPEAVRASHILILATEPDAENKARALRSSLSNIEDFKAVCGTHSQCPSGVRCGDLGWFPRGRMVKEIEDIAFSLEIGEISDVFMSQYGYHVLLVTDKKVQQPVPFEDIKESLKARLIRLEKEFFLTRHVNDLRKNSKDSIIILDKDYIISN